MKLLDINEAAKVLGVSRWTVSTMIEEGALQAVVLRTGKKKRILRVRDDVLRKFLGISKNEMVVLEPALISPKKKTVKKERESFDGDHDESNGQRKPAVSLVELTR